MHKELTVSNSSRGERLDKFLHQVLDSISRSKIHLFIEEGRILIDEKPIKPSYHLKGGEKISISIEEEKKELKPFEFKVKIIYEDSDIIVVDKPQGLTTHPPQASYNETLVNALLYMGKDLFTAEELRPGVVHLNDVQLRPGVVHRLDKETSGAMVLAKNETSYKSLVDQFKNRKVQKEYQAICWGVIKKDHLNVDLPVARDAKNRLKMKVSFLKSRQALTKIDVLERFKSASLLSLKLITGRMHQIRVHLKFLGFPLVGDKKYGKKDKYDNLFLHAHKLGFNHPRTNKFMEFTSPLPKRFNDFIKEEKCTK
jgi:23S rRNA pseudouridine1911/1915/1917 synthase